MPWPLHEHPSQVIDIFTSYVPGFRLVDGGDLKTMADLLFSTRENIMAGDSQADATPIDTFISQIVDGDTVVLPPGLPGRYLMIYNETEQPIQIYGNPLNILTGAPDTIATDVSNQQQIMVTQDGETISEYVCFAPGMWKQFQGFGSGPGGGPSGIPDAPLNGVTYGRMNGMWVPVLPLSGGPNNQMTGPLILAPGTPTDPNQAISLSYILNLAIDEGTY